MTGKTAFTTAPHGFAVYRVADDGAKQLAAQTS